MMGHNQQILDQFTQQAERFAQAATVRSEEILERIFRMTQTGPEDSVLDVACGAGTLACAFARVAHHVTGIDLTPAMLEQARKNQAMQNLANISWELGNVTHLPCGDGQFDIVSCRFAFHHFPEPLAVLQEMVRVCRIGGRIVVADSAPAASKAEAFNAMEKMRDPSHVRAMPVEELAALFASAGLPDPGIETLRLPGDLDSLLTRSFPKKGDAELVRAQFEDALSEDFLDITPSLAEGKLLYSFPIAIFSAQKIA
jgi:ubiquinone/menaquinone biosynthesis C-methylase UbiE